MSYLSTHQPCPHCTSSDALSINIDGSTYCHSCERYTASGNVDELSDDSGYEEGREMSAVNVNIKEEIRHIQVNKALLDSGVSMALSDRGITKETCQVFNVTVRGNKHFYPYYNEDGEWVANKIRRSSADGQKRFSTVGEWGDAQLFGQKNFSKGGKYITICEGELDALAAYQMMGSKWPVVSIRNGASSVLKDIEASFEYLMSYDNIVLCFDNDEPGKKAAKKAAELLAPKARIVHLLKHKDANEYLLANDKEGFMKSWWNADNYTPDGIVSGTTLWDSLKNGVVKTSVVYPYDGMNRMTYGIRMGELITVCAGTGIGKSSFLREIIKHIFDNTDDNIGLMFMEENVRNTAEAIMSLELCKQLHLPDTEYTEQEYEEAFNNTVGSGRYFFFDHFGSNSIDSILSRIRYFAKAAKCKYVILDHISIIVSSQEHAYDERRTIDECMTKLRTLVQELDICLLMVSHLRRPLQGSHEEGLNTSLSDLRGSASIGQLSDIVIGLERNGQADDLIERHTTYVRVIKNRFSGLTGLCAKLFYDFKEGRIREKSLDLEAEDKDNEEI